MSAQATAYVWEHSPHTGAKLLIHLAVADVVNDAHDNEFYMSSERLARKVRMGAGNVRTRLAELVDNGDLEVIQFGGGKATTRYRFLFNCSRIEPRPQDEGVASTEHIEPRSENAGVALTERGGRVERTRGSRSENARNSIELKGELKKHTLTRIERVPDRVPDRITETRATSFDEFWTIYPRKTSKEAARRSFAKLNTDDIAAVMDGVKFLAHCHRRALDAQPDDAGRLRVKRFTPHPSTWLNAGRWQDDPDEVMAHYASMTPQGTTSSGDDAWSLVSEHIARHGSRGTSPDEWPDEIRDAVRRAGGMLTLGQLEPNTARRRFLDAMRDTGPLG